MGHQKPFHNRHPSCDPHLDIAESVPNPHAHQTLHRPNLLPVLDLWQCHLTSAYLVEIRIAS